MNLDFIQKLFHDFQDNITLQTFNLVRISFAQITVVLTHNLKNCEWNNIVVHALTQKDFLTICQP